MRANAAKIKALVRYPASYRIGAPGTIVAPLLAIPLGPLPMRSVARIGNVQRSCSEVVELPTFWFAGAPRLLARISNQQVGRPALHQLPAESRQGRIPPYDGNCMGGNPRLAMHKGASAARRSPATSIDRPTERCSSPANRCVGMRTLMRTTAFSRQTFAALPVCAAHGEKRRRTEAR